MPFFVTNTFRYIQTVTLPSAGNSQIYTRRGKQITEANLRATT